MVGWEGETLSSHSLTQPTGCQGGGPSVTHTASSTLSHSFNSRSSVDYSISKATLAAPPCCWTRVQGLIRE